MRDDRPGRLTVLAPVAASRQSAAEDGCEAWRRSTEAPLREQGSRLARTALAGTLLAVLGATSILAAQLSLPTPGGNSPLLTNAQQVLDLSREQAKANPPVQIQGVVTCYDPGRLLFVQDDTAGVFIYHTGEPLPLKIGQQVQVAGVANSGLYSPFIDSPVIKPAERGPTIGPKLVSLNQVYLGFLDAQWVELSGVVRAQDLSEGRLKLELADPPYRLTVWIPDHKGYEQLGLVDSWVRLRGVVGVGTDERKHMNGFQLFANTLADLTVIHGPNQDLLASSPSSIGDLNSHYVRRGALGTVQVQGAVTLCWPGRALFIQDATGGLEIRPRSALENLPPGTWVDVVGHLGPLLSPPLLEDALVRKLQSHGPPQPVRLLSEDLFHAAHNCELVEIEARFLALSAPSSNHLTLALQEGDRFVSAILPGPGSDGALAMLEPGSRLRLVGVCRSEVGSGSNLWVSLLLRSPTDIHVIGLPTRNRGRTSQVLAVVALLAGAGLVGALFVLQKQRRVTERLLQFQATLRSEMTHGEQQLGRSMEERERMARDLHDDIIQSIYAIGLNLEDCRRVARQTPEKTEASLATAIHTLNTAIHSVRGFIAGLEPKVLNGREFKTALKSLALTSGDSPIQFQIEVDPAAANRLTSTQATQLLHIAKEAMSNSLRHARASLVSVTLDPLGSGVRLEIRDDGVGFDSRTGGGAGHGLSNMAARARDIGGELQIISAPAQGCRILANVPQRNSNEPN